MDNEKLPGSSTPPRIEQDEVVASETSDSPHHEPKNTLRPSTDNHSLPNRILSRISSRASLNPGPPPDGGTRAWMCVLGTHLVVMNTWGLVNSFGVFQTYYVQFLNRPPSDISWIGSFQIFLLLFIGAFTGRLTDAGFLRPIIILGAILVVLGSLTASVCTSYWQLFLAQGICIGLGNGCLFCPAISVVSTYFSKRRGIAIGITACGSTTGGIVFPILVRQILPKVGFGWAMRSIGFIQAGTLAVAIAMLKSRITPRKTGPFIDFAAFKELEYTFYAIATFSCFLGLYFGFFFVAAYARDIQSMSYAKSLDLIMIMSGVGTIGRLLPNFLADRFGTLTIFAPTAACLSLLMYAWMAVSSQAGLYAWASISGINAGGIQAMFPAALAALTTDPNRQGTRMGMIFTIVSFAVLIGPPIQGAIISAQGGKYAGAQAFAGSTLALGTVFLIAGREVKRRKLGLKLWGKV